MNEAVVNSMSIINGLNKVGFDPSAFLRRLTGENGEEQFYLDVKYRKLWFRLMHPEGKITKRIIKLENEFAIIKAGYIWIAMMRRRRIFPVHSPSVGAKRMMSTA